jgi:CheY-like chemotaxis protein
MRRTEALKNVPAICLSGYGGPAEEDTAREAGFDRFIQKPCLPDVLAHAATELLRTRRQGGGNR